MKRFYTLVTTHKTPQGFEIHLDGKPVKTKMGQALRAPSAAIADLALKEWAGQGDHIVPDSMPVTQILSTQIDQVAQSRAAMTAALLKYLDTDLLCYRCGAEPDGQQEAQARAWDPWLDWFERRFGARLETTTGLSALAQPPAAHSGVQTAVENLDDLRFTILQMVVPLSGSLVLGLAFVEGAIAPEELFACTHVEEDFKAAIYNEALHGPAPLQAAKDAAMMRDLTAAAQVLTS